MNLHSGARTCPASRALLIGRVREMDWSVTRAATAAGISRRTAHKWLSRSQAGEPASLQDRSSRPRHRPGATPVEWQQMILLLLRMLNQEHGKTIVMVTHDPKAAEYASRQLHLDKGTLAPANWLIIQRLAI